NDFVFFPAAVTEGWMFPKQKTRLHLPLDYPLHHPFYKVVAVPEFVDTQMNTTDGPWIEFSIRKIQVHLQSRGESRVLKKQQTFISIDRHSGVLWFTRKPMDVGPKSISQGKTIKSLLVNFTVHGNTKSKGPAKKIEFILVLNGNVSTYCDPKATLCFPNLETTYRISEASSKGIIFDYLMNPGFSSLCPNTTLLYRLATDPANPMSPLAHMIIVTSLSTHSKVLLGLSLGISLPPDPQWNTTSRQPKYLQENRGIPTVIGVGVVEICLSSCVSGERLISCQYTSSTAEDAIPATNGIRKRPNRWYARGWTFVSRPPPYDCDGSYSDLSSVSTTLKHGYRCCDA
ncbi:uncharacterized protein LOC118201562, partial [Stegodyphus dumicola]|uniref:uncharacterized protein LOC118201562 n=1 Tax=Stegodyphus dumicola TaxID=202533 RepID=UPI0015B2A905